VRDLFETGRPGRTPEHPEPRSAYCLIEVGSTRTMRFGGRRREADGFSVLEVVVALGIFAIMSTAVMAGILGTLHVTRDDKNRVRAAGLAAREIDIVRAAFTSRAIGAKRVQAGQVTNPNPLPGGTVGQPEVVDGVAYTIVRTSEWTQQGATAGPCDISAPGYAPLAYLRVTVTVSWPGMGGVQPIVSNTLLTPPLGTFTQGTGHLRATVSDGSGARVPGLQVVITGPGGTTSQLTSDGGCAFFPGLPVGTYTITVSATGGIDHDTWAPTATRTTVVVANGIAQANIAYAAATTLTAGLQGTVAAHPPAKAIPLNLYNTDLAPSSTKGVPGVGDTRTLPVWPYPDGLDAWGGTCNDADPLATGGDRQDPAVLTPGGAAAAVIPLAPVVVSVRNNLGQVAGVGTIVYAVHAKDQTTGCSLGVSDPVDGGTNAGQVLEFPVVTNSSGEVHASLPYGTWRIKVKTLLPQGAWPAVTLSASTPATTVTPIVVTTLQ
jgi:type II secretory pathway pseudopilin PulG